MIPHSAKINTYQKSEARSQKSEFRIQIIVAASGGFCIVKRKAPHYSDFCPLSFCFLYLPGGGERVRTDDLLRARQALTQLSYTPGIR
jgi:oxalate decarboxylase/phosphoglucose isomerase-like protein (cupin superfamily)